MKGAVQLYAAVFSVRNINPRQLQHRPPQAGHPPTPPPEPHLLFMDRLIDAVAEYLCRHRSVGLLRLTLDLTRRRLDLFAEIGAVEVVKGVVAPPTPGTDAWWRAVAAVREAVYALRERGLAQYVREADVVNWIGPPPLTNPTPNRQMRRMAFFPAFFSSSPSRRAEEWRLVSTQRRVE